MKLAEGGWNESMAKNEKDECKQAPIEEITEEELEAASAAGLSPIRKINGKRYEMVAVALKDNTRKCQELQEFAQQLKAQRVPCKLEEKAACFALYICAE